MMISRWGRTGIVFRLWGSGRPTEGNLLDRKHDHKRGQGSDSLHKIGEKGYLPGLNICITYSKPKYS